MDFTLDDEMSAITELAEQVFGSYRTDGGDLDETQLRAALGQADLLGLHLPLEHGGNGLGVSAPMAVLEQQGRVADGAPLWPTVAASEALARFGHAAETKTLLPRLATGLSTATVALEEFGAVDPSAPTTTATESNGAWTLSGTKAAVPMFGELQAVVVAASSASGPGLFAVHPESSGVTWEATATTDEAPAANLLLDGAAATYLGGDEALRHVLDVATLGVCATQLGVMQGALALAASYVSERHQFGRPLATFQAVQHMLADCYIDIDASRVTMWQALSDIQEGVERRQTSVPVAHWWAAKAGLDVVHRTQHLHGGTGVDRDFPAHRFYLWARQLANTLGNEHRVLTRLGDNLASSGVVTGELS